MQGHVEHLPLGPLDGPASTLFALGCAYETVQDEHLAVVKLRDVLELGIVHDLVVAGSGLSAYCILVATAVMLTHDLLPVLRHVHTMPLILRLRHTGRLLPLWHLHLPMFQPG